MLRAAGIPALCHAWARINWRWSRLGSACGHSGCCHSEHHACSWLLRAGSAPLTCVRVHACMCPSASMCITYPCASVCIRVQCASACLCTRPLQPCVLHACGPGLAWGSTLGLALGSRSSRRLIPSRCGCRGPGSHRLLTRPMEVLFRCCWRAQSSTCPAPALQLGCLWRAPHGSVLLSSSSSSGSLHSSVHTLCVSLTEPSHPSSQTDSLQYVLLR